MTIIFQTIFPVSLIIPKLHHDRLIDAIWPHLRNTAQNEAAEVLPLTFQQ